MQKPTHSDPPIDHILYGMAQMENERKENCIHCGKRWYSIHYRDGVCARCREEKKPGRSELARRRSLDRKVALGVAAAVTAVILIAIYS